MAESKKKATKKEVVDKDEDVIKSVKKTKVKEKPIEQVLDEELLPENEVEVKTKTNKKTKAEVEIPVKAEVAETDEAVLTSEEKKSISPEK